MLEHSKALFLQTTTGKLITSTKLQLPSTRRKFKSLFTSKIEMNEIARKFVSVIQPQKQPKQPPPHKPLQQGKCVDLKLHKLTAGGEPQDQGYASERSPEDEHPPSLPGQPFPPISPGKSISSQLICHIRVMNSITFNHVLQS